MSFDRLMDANLVIKNLEKEIELLEQEVFRWKLYSTQQNKLMKQAISELKNLRKVTKAYTSKYGLVTETVDGDIVSEGIELFNTTSGYRPPGKVARFKTAKEG